MPELPEVDAITGIAKKYSVGNAITRFEILRWNGKYFHDPKGPRLTTKEVHVTEVFRYGKQIVFVTGQATRPSAGLAEYLVVHNAMTGYFDWQHEPWTFDYVEAERTPTESDIRVKFHFRDGKVLRFHDARLFGSMRFHWALNAIGPELLRTPHGMQKSFLMTNKEFYEGLRTSRPIKARLMEQSFMPGIGNIYANEACHLAGIDPRKPANEIRPELIPVLFEALKCSVLHSIPKVTYQWLNVYRRSTCGTCTGPVKRIEINKRATFLCESCQIDP